MSWEHTGEAKPSWNPATDRYRGGHGKPTAEHEARSAESEDVAGERGVPKGGGLALSPSLPAALSSLCIIAAGWKEAEAAGGISAD